MTGFEPTSRHEKSTMNIDRSKLAIAVALGAVIATTAFASAYPGEKLASQAAVNIVRARTLANAVVPGKILTQELETEAGGSGLRYTFDIRGAHGVREVGIDAKSGRVLENSAETAESGAEAPESPSAEGPESAKD